MVWLATVVSGFVWFFDNAASLGRAARQLASEKPNLDKFPQQLKIVLRAIAPSRRPLCVTFPWYDLRQRRPVFVIVLVPLWGGSEAIRACLTEEVSQALGLRVDSRLNTYSIFNDDDRFTELTPIDELMSQILYDPRLKPGMTREEAMPIAAVILGELLASRQRTPAP